MDPVRFHKSEGQGKDPVLTFLTSVTVTGFNVSRTVVGDPQHESLLVTRHKTTPTPSTWPSGSVVRDKPSLVTFNPQWTIRQTDEESRDRHRRQDPPTYFHGPEGKTVPPPSTTTRWVPSFGTPQGTSELTTDTWPRLTERHNQISGYHLDPREDTDPNYSRHHLHT